MLLIDSVRYIEWVPQTEDEFEQLVKEHAQDIFGENSIYLEMKQKIRSISGIGSIPDGYVITMGNPCNWHIVEIELSSHPLYEHIVSQVTKFISGISNPNIQRNLVNAIYDEITGDDFLKLKLKKAIEPVETYKFLADLVSNQPMLTIIIERDTESLRETLNVLHYTQIKVVEFRTFTREEVGLTVHAHLFQPIYTPSPTPTPYSPTLNDSEKLAKKVTFEELVNAGLIRDGQNLSFYHTRVFNEERAQVIASSNQLKYETDGGSYSKSELAKRLLIKHGFKHDEHGVAGPRYWITEDGKFLRELEEQIRAIRGDRIQK